MNQVASGLINAEIQTYSLTRGCGYSPHDRLEKNHQLDLILMEATHLSTQTGGYVEPVDAFHPYVPPGPSPSPPTPTPGDCTDACKKYCGGPFKTPEKVLRAGGGQAG